MSADSPTPQRPDPGPNTRHEPLAGAAFALAAGLLWGLVFIAPLLLPQYPPALLSSGRYLAFGLVALALAWFDRGRLAQLSRSDWTEALKLSAIGNLLYYLCLAAAIQQAGAPLPTMIIGTLPVVIAVSAAWPQLRREGPRALAPLAPSLAPIALGIWLVQQAEAHGAGQGAAAGGLSGQALGVLLAIGAVACWTWYPLRNSAWLRAHPGRSSGTWATAQGLATLPLSLALLLAYWAWTAASGSALPMPLGPDPLRFVVLMLALGLLASWLGTLCWNQASQRLSPGLAGQLIVFETLAALAYAYALRAQWPGWTVALGAALLVAGVCWALRRKPEAAF